MNALLHSVLPTLQQATADPRLCVCSQTPTGKSGTVSTGLTAIFSWVLVHKVLLCPPRVYFPALCKFWQLYGGVNGDLLQEGLCHTQVCRTQSPCPCDRPRNSGNSDRLFLGAPKALQILTAAMKLKDAYSLEEKLQPT